MATSAEAPRIQLELLGRVGVLTFDNPPVNALSTAALLDLRRAMEDAVMDPRVDCIVLRGAGTRAFMAGADIRELRDWPVGVKWVRTEIGQGLTVLMEQCDKIIIAAIHGFCLGGGCEIAMAADIRLSSTDAVYGQPEINLGIMPGFGGTQRLTRLVGKTRAIEMLLTGRRISADEALRAGLVGELVDPHQLYPRAMSLANQIAASSSGAIAAIKRAVNQGLQVPLNDGLVIERDEFLRVRESADAAEGIAAFLEKRPPEFGRDAPASAP